MFDQNYQFDEIARLRRRGVRTVGRFVWEHFSEEHVAPAGEAFDRVYSLTAVERERYADMGIESPRVRWGCHPELLSYAAEPLADERASGVDVPLSRGLHVEAEAARGDDRGVPATRGRAAAARRQGPGRAAGRRRSSDGSGAAPASAARDRRIELVTEDLPTDDYLRMLAAADVCLAPSRWEGLGLHLFEATALGVPIVTNDNPPMNEVVIDGRQRPARARRRRRDGAALRHPGLQARRGGADRRDRAPRRRRPARRARGGRPRSPRGAELGR